MIKEIFEQCGFNLSEAEVYETILLLGVGSPQQIAKHAGVSRENTYRILEVLEKNNLVSKTTSNKKIEYIAESPQKLLEILDLRESELQKTKFELKNSIEAIKLDMLTERNKPVVVQLQGEKGLQHAFMETIDGEGGIQFEIMHRNWSKSFKKWISEIFIPLRIARNIDKNTIIANSDQGNELIKRNSIERRRTITIKTGKFPESTAVISYGDKVAMITSEENENDSTSIVISHRIVAQAIRGMIEIVWDKFKKQLID